METEGDGEGEEELTAGEDKVGSEVALNGKDG